MIYSRDEQVVTPVPFVAGREVSRHCQFFCSLTVAIVVRSYFDGEIFLLPKPGSFGIWVSH